MVWLYQSQTLCSHGNLNERTIMNSPIIKLNSSRVLRSALAIGAVSLAALLGGCATTASEPGVARTGKWELFDKMQPVAASEQSRIFVYRKATPNDFVDGELKPVNIYVDGAYLASLLPNASAQTLVCPGNHRISGLTNKQEVALSDKSQHQISVNLPSGGMHYFMAQVGPGQVIRLSPIAVDAAMSEMQQLPRQAHTISRTAALQCDAQRRAASAS
jgi:hypothetical protein